MSSNKNLSIESLKAQWHLADAEGKKWLSEVQRQENYDLNAIASISMNACIAIKRYVEGQIGKAITQEVGDAE